MKLSWSMFTSGAVVAVGLLAWASNARVTGSGSTDDMWKTIAAILGILLMLALLIRFSMKRAGKGSEQSARGRRKEGVTLYKAVAQGAGAHDLSVDRWFGMVSGRYQDVRFKIFPREAEESFGTYISVSGNAPDCWPAGASLEKALARSPSPEVQLHVQALKELGQLDPEVGLFKRGVLILNLHGPDSAGRQTDPAVYRRALDTLAGLARELDKGAAS